MSFGSSETACTIVDDDGIFVQSGVAFFGAAGDEPAVRDYPAMSSNVVAVGGTTLQLSGAGDRLSETVWRDTGCGPSAYEPRPVFQDQFYSIVGLYRAGCDVAAVADPNTGVAVYDSLPYQGVSGWMELGGTSIACPVMAGIVNSSGTQFGSSQSLNTALYALAGTSSWNAITSGTAGGYAGGSPWCFPAGLGSPNGLAASLAGAHPVPSVRSRMKR
jgi:subtilase family serine protease